MINVKAGDLLRIDGRASVQFAQPIWFRLIRTLPRTTYEGWVWLDGYELDNQGNAIERREIFVQISGLRPASRTDSPAGRARNAGPAALAPQRLPSSRSTRSSRTRS